MVLDKQGINRIVETINNFLQNESDSITSVINTIGGGQYLFTIRTGPEYKAGDEKTPCVLEFINVERLEEEWDKEQDEIKEPKRYEQ